MRFGGLRRRAGRWAGGGLTALVLALAAAGAPFGVEAEADVEAVFDERGEPRWAEASEIDRFLRAQFEELRLPGLAVLVVTRDGVRFEGMYGNADPAGRPVSSDTPFLLGSTSKQFTALAVHQLVVQGRLGLENTVGALVPELAGTDSAFAAVTVEQLLGHTSGLSLNAGHEIWSLWPQADSIRDEARRLLRDRPDAPPGEDYQYSNANYIVLGAIIEAVSGSTYEAALQDLVASPLGLDATTSDLDRAHEAGLADGNYTWFRTVNLVTPSSASAAAAPAAYVTASARDLSRLVGAHLGAPSGVDPAVLEAVRLPRSRLDRLADYAGGWIVRPFWELTDRGAGWEDPGLPRIWEHDGNSLRAMSYIAFAPDVDVGVVVLTNTGRGTDDRRFLAFTSELLHEVVGTRPAPRTVDPLIAAAPLIMVGIPALQLVAILWLMAVGRRPPPSSIARWMPVAIGALATAAGLVVAFVILPDRSRASLIDTWWWVGAPDLALSIGVSLALSACWIALITARLARRSRRRAGAQKTSGLGVEA